VVWSATACHEPQHCIIILNFKRNFNNKTKGHQANRAFSLQYFCKHKVSAKELISCN